MQFVYTIIIFRYIFYLICFHPRIHKILFCFITSCYNITLMNFKRFLLMITEHHLLKPTVFHSYLKAELATPINPHPAPSIRNQYIGRTRTAQVFLEPTENNFAIYRRVGALCSRARCSALLACGVATSFGAKPCACQWHILSNSSST